MITVVINGTSFDYPEVGDTEWGDAATNAFKALAGSTLQNAVDISDPTATNEFTLLNTLDLGGNYGVKVLFISSRSSNPAQSGVFRLSNNELVAWRNGNNDGDNTVTFDASDNFVINGNTISFDVNGEMLVNGVQVTRSGEIVNADVAAAAGIEESKLALDHGTTALYNNIENHKSNKTTAHGMDITTPVKDDTLIYDDIDSVWKNKPNTVDNLKNVNITSIQDGQILSYDLANTEWKNTTNSIDNLKNVNITTIQDKQIISYDNNSSNWINTDNSVNNLSDTSIVSPASGQVLTYDGNDSKWKNLPSASASLTGLTDTTITTPADGDTLVYDSVSTKWINSNSLTTHLADTNNPHDTTISNLDDTTITTPSDQDTLVYDSNSSKWINQENSLDNLSNTDIDSNTVAENDVMVYDDVNQKWINSQILVNHIGNTANPHLTTVAKLTDASITTPANNDVLLYDYANLQWINSPIIEINDVANINTATTDITMTASDKRHQILTATDGFNITLPSTNIKAGEKFIFDFSGNLIAFPTTSIVFYVGSTIFVYCHTKFFRYIFTALVDNPSATTDWLFDYEMLKQPYSLANKPFPYLTGTHLKIWNSTTGGQEMTATSNTLFTLPNGVYDSTLRVSLVGGDWPNTADWGFAGIDKSTGKVLIGKEGTDYPFAIALCKSMQTATGNTLSLGGDSVFTGNAYPMMTNIIYSNTARSLNVGSYISLKTATNQYMQVRLNYVYKLIAPIFDSDIV